MKRWALLIAASGLAIAGCGGGGGGGGGGPAPVPGQMSINPAVFNKPGRIEVTYDTGQGRVPGSQTAVVRHFYVQDNIGLVETLLQAPLHLQLDAYTSQGLAVNPPMNGFQPPAAGRLFQSFPLEIDSFIVEQFDGSFITYRHPSGTQPLFTDNFALRARAFPGRSTIVQIFIDDATIFVDETTPPPPGDPPIVVFDRQRFEDLNYDPFDQRINGFTSDYVSFDITSVANKPLLTSGAGATRVYFSGDQIALSLDPTPSGNDMEVLTPLSPPIEALVRTAVTTPIQAAGTFTLRQIDPRDLGQIARITALQGIWRPYTDPNSSFSILLNVPQFAVFTLPHADDDEKQELFFIARNLLGEITEMYFGEVDFNALTFNAWPIENVDDGSVANEISGVITNVVHRAGVPTPTFKDIRSGSFTINSGTLPPGFSATGAFLVARL